jgi:hypothetical protein
MIRKISLSAAALSLFASLASAEVSFDSANGVNLKEEIAKTEVAAPEAVQDKGILDRLLAKPSASKGVAEWTIMVYVNGKNNLEPFAIKDINEMEQVGSTAKVNIVVEMGRMDGYDDSNGDWKTTRRYLVQKDKDTAKIGSKLIADLGDIDMGDYKNVIDFGNWAKQAYPAKKFMLIIWNHGSGWEKSVEGRITKGISYDEVTGNHINTVQLGQVLKGIGGVDVYGSDACLMQMAEVDYEIKDYAKVIVGSEETEPGDGYTYNTFLAPVVANPAMSPVELGKAAVNAYADHYQAGGREGSTQSLVNTASVPKLLSMVNDFAYAITQAGEKDLAKSARDGAAKFAIAENKDLYDFARLVVAGTKSADVKAKGQALMTFITSELVLANRTTLTTGGGWGEPTDYSLVKGISIYIPTGALGDGYTDMQWAKYSNWDEFVNWMNS